MTLSTVRAGVDAYVWDLKPTKNFGGSTRLRVASGTAAALIRFMTPAPRGATILSATLVTYSASAVAGDVTLTARRASAKWNSRNVTYDNGPGQLAEGAAAVTKNSPPAGTEWRFDVREIVQAWTDGQPNYGFRIASSTAALLLLHSMEGTGQRPYLEVEWTTAPREPTVLKPSYGAVSEPAPVVTCDYTDAGGGATACSAIQVQADAADDFTAPDWDSGTVLVPGVPVLDLAATSFPPLAAGATTYWRVRVQDGDGLWSAWSDSAPMTYQPQSALTILNPGAAPNDFVSEFTPPILWDFAGTQTHYRVIVGRYDSGKVKSTSNTHAIPKGVLVDGRAYEVRVQVWDDVAREGTDGAPVYVEARRTFTVAYDATIDPPETLTATQGVVGSGKALAPWVDLVWTRATAPDTWTIIRNGVAIEADATPGETITVDADGITYRYRDYSPKMEEVNQYRIASDVNGKLSAGGPVASITPSAVGTWLVDPRPGGSVVVLGGKNYDTVSDDVAETYQVLGSGRVARAVMGLTGLSGTVTDGLLYDRPWGDPAFTRAAMEKALYRMKENPTRTYRLVLGDLSIPVVLGNIKPAPHPETQAGRVVKAVSFAWWQVGEHPFTVDL